MWNTQRVINTGCSMEAQGRSTQLVTRFHTSISYFLHTRDSQDSTPQRATRRRGVTFTRASSSLSKSGEQMPLLTDESGAVHWIEDADLQTFLSTASATSAADAADGSVPLPAANNAAAPTDDVNTVFTLGAVPSSQLFVSTLGPVVSEPRQQFGPEVESAVDIWQPQSSAASASTAAQHEYESTPAPSTSNGRGCAYSSSTPAGTAGISSALDSTIFGGSASERALQSLIRVGSDNTGSAQSMIRVGSDKNRFGPVFDAGLVG